MRDLISREAAISAIMGEHPDAHYPDWYVHIIEELPEVELKQVEDGSVDSEQPEIKTDRAIDDCISRQAVLDLVKELTFENVEGLKYYRYRCIDPDNVRELPSVIPAFTWIPISEMCPKENGYYLTTTIYKEVYCDHWTDDRFDRTETVIAWMPLPEPYKGGETT